MTREEIIKMAREASDNSDDTFLEDNDDTVVLYVDELLRFASLVAAAEREACAKTCESTNLPDEPIVFNAVQTVVDAIRAMGVDK